MLNIIVFLRAHQQERTKNQIAKLLISTGMNILYSDVEILNEHTVKMDLLVKLNWFRELGPFRRKYVEDLYHLRDTYQISVQKI